MHMLYHQKAHVGSANHFFRSSTKKRKVLTMPFKCVHNSLSEGNLSWLCLLGH